MRKKIQLNALVTSPFWDWIKCHVSNKLLYRLSLEPAVRLIYHLTILIPSYNAQDRVPFLMGTKEGKGLLKAFCWSNRLIQRSNAINIVFIFIVIILLQKINTNFCVHTYSIICYFLEYEQNYLLVVLYDHKSSSSSSSSSNSKTNTNFVFIHIWHMLF